MSLPQRSYPAVYMRGGTSRALVFHARDLPAPGTGNDRSAWNAIFTAALGSPDAEMRQLDGMGGGISSLSKVAVVGPPSRPDADVDYTFAQIGIDRATVGYKGNCGNISSAIGPFAVDEGLVAPDGDDATVRIHNTNTGKIIRARFALQGGKAAVRGDHVLQGVAGHGAPIRLDFLDPGGAATGALFPTGRLRETLETALKETCEVSLIDLANPLAVIAASELGLQGDETPEELAANLWLMQRLKTLRRRAAIAMGLARDEEEATTLIANLPLIAIVSDGCGKAGLRARMISADQPHKATPLTGAMALAAAMRIAGTVAADHARPAQSEIVTLAHAAGNIELAAEVEDRGLASHIASVGVIRTARRLMAGEVFVPS
ncbi:2-methylaconitate cis-trans isomerase PrpF family protein [Paracoccus sp. J55]|uniref:2-methylaconitate cis-trans isomerase PrpF family protein n=1 Tax=Paracoccus sp. J55 TaxID=935849 RepID=UPI0004AEAD16|nr:PrpF domain-containing protein [Paracoccus sp. J55]